MKKLGVFLSVLLIAVTAYAAIDWEIPNNVMKMGDGAATSKSFEMRMGLGASNPILSSLDGTEMNINIPFRVQGALNVEGAGEFTGTLKSEGSNYTLGDGTNQDLSVNFDMNGTADIPAFKYDSASGELLLKKKVGANFKKFGSGSGGGGGENFNNGFGDDDNANAEDGTSGWTNFGGTFAVTLIDPLEGEQSFTYLPSAQNNYVESGVLSFDKDLFRGNACEGRVEYIGGDENLSLQIINGNAIVIAEQVLKPHGVFGQESVFFLCPNATEIIGDAELGNLRYRITNTGASVSPLIKFDKSYSGTLRGLVEVTLPDVASAKVQNNGVATLLSSSADVIQSVNRDAIGRVSVVFKAGIYTIPPVVLISSEKGADYFDIETYNVTTSGFSTFLWATSPFGLIDGDFNVSIHKQGVDAKQTVQVYKNLPKISENINEFTALINISTSSVLSSNTNWITSATKSAAGLANIVVDAGNTQNMACSCGQDVPGSRTTAFCNVYNQSLNTFSIQSANHVGADFDSIIKISCQKQGVDFKLPTVQLQLVNQVQTAAPNGTKLGVCLIQNSAGTPSFDPADPDCAHISSVGDVGTGVYQITTDTAGYKCVCSQTDTGNCSFASNSGGHMGTVSSFPNPFRIYVYTSNGGSLDDKTVSLSCSKNR